MGPCSLFLVPCSLFLVFSWLWCLFYGLWCLLSESCGVYWLGRGVYFLYRGVYFLGRGIYLMGPSFPKIDKTIFWNNSYGVLDGETLGSDLIINNSVFDISDVDLTIDINVFSGVGINSNDNPLFCDAINLISHQYTYIYIFFFLFLINIFACA